MGCTRRQDLLANRPSPYPSQVERQSPSNTNRCWKCERDIGQYKHSGVAAASPFLKASASSGAAFLLAKADGDSYTESLKSGGITFLVLLEAAPARAVA